MSIRLLDDQVINQIAAGEVVERPASVVKELVENALDAGATQIRVSLRGGGRQLIRITDDGAGMSRTDALMSLERHATSKIRRTEDLDGVDTLGFRGEAIPSIAAVSRFQLLTRPAEQEVGTRVRVEGGAIGKVADAGCAAGTEIDVGGLFFNLPARRKFLRTVQTELSHCVEAVIREALVRPDVDFSLYHDDRELLRAPATDDRAARARDLLKIDGKSLLPIRFEEEGIEVIGLISPLQLHRSTASGAMYLYVNGRYVRDPVLRRAVNEAYRDRIPRGRYPVVVIDVRLPPGAVDVNVHPSKVEVRFRDPRKLSRVLSEGLRDSLIHHGLQPRDEGSVEPVPALPLTRAAPPQIAHHPLFAAEGMISSEPPRLRASRPAALPEDDPGFRARPPAPREPDPIEALLGELPSALPASVPPPAEGREVVSESPAPAPSPTEADPPVQPGWAALRILGVAAGAYLLCEGPQGVAVIGLAQTQARQLFYELIHDREAALGRPQRLLAPALIALPRAELERLMSEPDRLEALGIEAERFGPGELAIRAISPRLKGVDLHALIPALSEAMVASAGDEVLLRIVAEQVGPAAGPPADLDGWLRTLDRLGVPTDTLSWIRFDELERRVRRG